MSTRRVTLVFVYETKTGNIVEYDCLRDDNYGSVQALLSAIDASEQRLKSAHSLPQAGLGTFEGTAPSLDSFFENFPNYKRTASTKANMI
jgi:hypothetical protein